MNFSTAHDFWFGLYSRSVSSPIYYRVCGELIAEVADLFVNEVEKQVVRPWIWSDYVWNHPEAFFKLPRIGNQP